MSIDNTRAGHPPEFSRATKDPLPESPIEALRRNWELYEGLARDWKKKRDEAEAKMHEIGAILTVLRQKAADTTEGYP